MPGKSLFFHWCYFFFYFDDGLLYPSVLCLSLQMLNSAREGVLATVAGVDDPPATLFAALSTRAGRLVSSLASERTRSLVIRFFDMDDLNFLPS